MSKCMTIVDKTIDQKDTCLEITPKDIAEFILEEIIIPTVIISEKGCNRIGDFNITEDFCQQFDQKRPVCLKNFEKVSVGHLSASAHQEPNLQSGENTDHSLSLLTAKENLDLIFDKCEDALKTDCKLISEEVLADNELQIKDGQVRLEITKTEDVSKSFMEATRQEYKDYKDVIKDEKIGIDYFNEGKINRIYIPLNTSNPKNENRKLTNVENELCSKEDKNLKVNEEICNDSFNEEKSSVDGQTKAKRTVERPFRPFTSEELRQSVLRVWGNGNSNVTGGWEGDISSQPEEVLRLMEGLSSIQVLPNTTADPNRPRACAFAEEDIKKIIKEIEEINFTQNHGNPEECETAYHSDGQGDVDLESKSFINKEPKQSVTFIKETEEASDNSDSESKSVLIKSRNSLRMSKGNFRDQEESPPLSKIFLDSEDSEKKNFTGEIELIQSKSRSCELGDKEELSSFCEEEEKSVNPNISTDDTIYNTAYFYYEKEENSKASLERQKSITLPILEKNTWVNARTESCESADQFLYKTEELIASDEIKAQGESSEENDSAEKSIGTERNELDGEEQQIGAEFISKHINESFNVSTRNETLEMLQHFKLDEEKVLGLFPEKLSEELKESRSVNDATNEFSTDFSSGKNLNDSKEEEKTEDNRVCVKNSEKKMVATADPPFSSETQLKNQNQEENDEALCISGGNPCYPSFLSEKGLLHSENIHSRTNFEGCGQPPKEMMLKELEEAFVESNENIIQIINPSENSTDELSNISFSLFNENTYKNSSGEVISVTDTDSEEPLFSINADKTGKNENENVCQKKTYSGMTTIGPLKNTDYDPKDLSGPDVDFGKMTRITSSRQIVKDFFKTDLKIVTSVRGIQESESNEDNSILMEGNRMELTSLINRDIASLTKVQKVREVMSYHPKADEDFEDDDNLTRPRLDLKDVESMTDERYKMTDVSAPLRSFEIGNDNAEDDQEIIGEMDLVLSGSCFNNMSDLENEIEEKKSFQNDEQFMTDSVPEKTLLKISSLKLLSSEPSEKTDEYFPYAETVTKSPKSKGQVPEISGRGGLQSSSDSINQKYGTLANVFKKASNKFIHKDVDLVLRNSKSLPRDTSKLKSSSSIKSVLDDCHSSASNVLKKSRSLMKNTQSIFKTLSQNRFNAQDSARNLSKQKASPSESDISNVEKKLSSLLRKEDFIKAKNIIKSKMEKTFKNFDGPSLPKSESRLSEEKNDLRVAVRNEENYRLDKMENFQKFLSKSPLMYKSQFVKSQVSIRNNVSENTEIIPTPDLPDDPQKTIKGQNSVTRKKTETNLKNDETCSKLTQMKEKEEMYAAEETTECESSQPAFIVMETVRGLPLLDAESPREIENENITCVENADTRRDIDGLNALKCETQKSLKTALIPEDTKTAHDFTGRNGKEPRKTPKKSKDKKFAARFRSFWSSTFGKIKATPRSTDPS